jgi:catechol 2,3-dioxygenase-like lactoylglutathione lyase family enzyme
LEQGHEANRRTALTMFEYGRVAAEPQLFVANISASCDFYTKKLGFAVAFTYGESAFYG